jgi:hypothetical protein
MLVKVPEARSPPVHVYAVPEGAALAIPVVPTNPVATAPDDATTMAAPNTIRNFIFAPFVCSVSPEASTAPEVRHTLALAFKPYLFVRRKP